MKHSKILSIVLLVLVTTGFFVRYTVVPHEKHPKSYGKSDFAVFYATGKVLLADGNPYDEKTLKKTIRQYRKYNGGWRFLYPPAAGLIFIPLSFFKIKQAIWIWYTVSILCLGLMIYLLQRIRKRRFSALELSAIAALCIVFAPIFTNLRLGQVNILLTLIFVLHLFAISKKKVWLAGVSLATLISFKIFPGILLFYYLLRRDWKIIGYTLLSGIGIFVLSILLLGTQVHIEYLSVLLSLSNQIGLVAKDLVKFDNATIYGSVLRILTYWQGGPPFEGWQTTVATIVRGIGSIGIFVALTIATMRNRKQPPHIIEVTLWIGFTLLAATEIHTQYFLYYLPMLIMLLLYPPVAFTKKRNSILILIATLLIGYSFRRVLPTFIKDTPGMLISYAFIGHLILLYVLVPWLLNKREYSEEDISPLATGEKKT